jgi:hypothetical protein
MESYQEARVTIKEEKIRNKIIIVREIRMIKTTVNVCEVVLKRKHLPNSQNTYTTVSLDEPKISGHRY